MLYYIFIIHLYIYLCIFKNKLFLRKTANTITSIAGNTSSVLGFGIGDNTFTKFKKIDMTKLIQQYNKNTYVIKQYSKLPVSPMSHMLSHHFTLVDNKLVRKNEVINPVVSKPKKRITPQLVIVQWCTFEGNT